MFLITSSNMETDMAKITTSESHYEVHLRKTARDGRSPEEFQKLKNEMRRTFKFYKTRSNAETAIRMSKFDRKDVYISEAFYMGFGF